MHLSCGAVIVHTCPNLPLESHTESLFQVQTVDAQGQWLQRQSTEMLLVWDAGGGERVWPMPLALLVPLKLGPIFLLLEMCQNLPV